MFDVIAKVQGYAAYAKKAVIAYSTGVLIILNQAVPDYSDEAQWIVSAVVAFLGAVATYKATNAPEPVPYPE